MLDTWFSSALWPFSTLGWPDSTHALKKFYPGDSDLETGYDILFFWVARMMMFGLHFMGRCRSARVLLSRADRRRDRRQDEQGEGQRHRSAGSRLRRDVRDMVKKALPGRPRPRRSRSSRRRTRRPRRWAAAFPAFGADAVRFTLATYPPSNKRIALAPKRIEGNRHFLNKIWNATRLALEPARRLGACDASARPRAKGFLYNRWIRSRFASRVRRSRTTASTRSASTRPRTPRTASSGTTSATGTSSS